MPSQRPQILHITQVTAAYGMQTRSRDPDLLRLDRDSQCFPPHLEMDRGITHIKKLVLSDPVALQEYWLGGNTRSSGFTNGSLFLFPV